MYLTATILHYFTYTAPTITLHGTLLLYVNRRRETAVAQWLRCCATNRKVVGSIPDGVIGIFH